MKILKKRKPAKQIKTTCRHCKAVLSAPEDSLRWEYDQDGRLARRNCPECKGEVFFY